MPEKLLGFLGRHLFAHFDEVFPDASFHVHLPLNGRFHKPAGSIQIHMFLS